ncbi:MAG TPA: hypothetical protein ENG40_00445, partial [Thermoprotei archaeon]|nr:hypothetical protein [Thermoprotei archaeon]
MDLPRETLIRKSIHILFTFLLFIPFTPIYSIFCKDCSPIQYYLFMAIVSSILNAIKIKNPIIGSEIIERIRSFRREMINDLHNIRMMKTLPLGSSLIEKLEMMENFIEEFERNMDIQLNLAERRYEKIGGYIGVSAGIIGILFSYIFFKEYAIYGIYALMIVDPVGAIIGKMYGSRRIKWSNASLEGSIAEFLAYALFLLLIGFKPCISLITSLITTLAEI